VVTRVEWAEGSKVKAREDDEGNFKNSDEKVVLVSEERSRVSSTGRRPIERDEWRM